MYFEAFIYYVLINCFIFLGWQFYHQSRDCRWKTAFWLILTHCAFMYYWCALSLSNKPENKINKNLFSMSFDVLECFPPVCGVLEEFLVSVLDGHDQVLHHITVFLPAELRQTHGSGFHAHLPLSIRLHLTYQHLQMTGLNHTDTHSSTHTHRETRTDRQTDTHTDRQTDRQTDTHTHVCFLVYGDSP